MGVHKACYFRFSLCFDGANPIHAELAEILNAKGRRKADYISWMYSELKRYQDEDRLIERVIGILNGMDELPSWASIKPKESGAASMTESVQAASEQEDIARRIADNLSLF